MLSAFIPRVTHRAYDGAADELLQKLDRGIARRAPCLRTHAVLARYTKHVSLVYLRVCFPFCGVAGGTKMLCCARRCNAQLIHAEIECNSEMRQNVYLLY
jgi:hypothetical protein